MIKIFVFILNSFLILIIFLRLPQENTGLESFATKSKVFGSPNSTQRLLNTITAISIFIYLGLALKLNFGK